MTYLDWAATSPPDNALLLEAAECASKAYGNPSSAHAQGRDARRLYESARFELASALGCRAKSVIFTSGGTESDIIPLLSFALIKRNPSILTSAIEHEAVAETCRKLATGGCALSSIHCGPDGVVSAESVVAALERSAAAGSGKLCDLVAVMSVNNETGAIAPMADIVAAVRSLPGGDAVHIHCDAVQALGKVAFAPAALGIDTAAFSSHKIRGPRGIGALFVAKPFEAFLSGGGQEQGMRPGTENLQGAYAFAKAARTATRDLERDRENAKDLCERLYAGLEAIKGAVPIPECRKARDERYSPFIASLAFPGLSGETMVRVASDAGVMISTGSACSSAKRERRVLDAMKIPRDLSFSAVRVSFGPASAAADVDRLLEVAESAYRKYAS